MSTMNILQAKEILNYKRFGSDTSLSDIDIPETAQNRKRTDKYFLYIFIGFIVVLISLLIYTLHYSDINRFNGVDICGNVCGEKNVKYDQWNCTGKDMTDKPKFNLLICETVSSKNDSDFLNILNILNREDDDFRRADEEYIKNANAFGKMGWKIALSSLFTLGYCIIMVILFRHATAVVVWGSLILAWICLFSITLYLWINVKNETNGGIGSAIGFSIVVLTLSCLMVFLHKRIPLVIMLFKESAKAVYDIPLIFFVPVVTIFTLVIITTALTVSTVYMFTSGILTEVLYGILMYVPDTWMWIALFLNVVMAYWATQFIGGIQYMVISGAISKWYFTQNKTLMGSPILTSAFIAFKFHLGTIALGSLIISLVTILRTFLKTLGSLHSFKLLEECCMEYLERLLKFFTKNSYIITAMHGTSFLQSGKQAVKLIALNICNTIVLNFTGDFVFLMAHLLIVCLSLLTARVLFLGEPHGEYLSDSYTVVCVLAVICSYTILGTFQTAMDTIFMCFCEDCLINDGVNKPYAMSRDFMEFVEGSKRVFEKKIRETGLPTI